MTADPSRPPTEASRKRAERRAREKNFEYSETVPPNNLPPNSARAGVPLDPRDAVRLKLREKARQVKVGANTGPHLELPTLPGVNALAFATRYIDGGRETFIEFVQLAVLENQPSAHQFYEVYRDLTAYERTHCSFDDVCAAAGIKPSKLMAEVISVVMEAGRDAGNLIAAMTHPKVVAKLVESAQRIDGPEAEISQKDRHAYLQGAGVIPVPRGTSIHVSASANAKAAAAAAVEPTMPSFTGALTTARQSQQQAVLPAHDVSDEELSFLNAGSTQPTQVAEAVLISPDPDDEE